MGPFSPPFSRDWNPPTGGAVPEENSFPGLLNFPIAKKQEGKMISPLLLSLATLVPIVSSILSSSQDSQLMNLLASSRGASDGYPEWILQSSKAVKKYDRNCFFSPVQCMLSFNQGQEQPIVFTSKGKRLYYYRK
nr:unnamed protein product [Haemonchus contortus]